ncbi:aromatic ring-cleaving dioxygenase [Crossiella equi]|uniref:Aromatic ring-cleaving dioxygenase n=1 Tax=Crossiella equi TaxID=130796 RepID=A0ABS5A4K5_9PSEU|nr:hypothetical protein [Crossiella equi]MBP2471159.1 aromatic ring-cleaving dioxygenase [Crossiella equi]
MLDDLQPTTPVGIPLVKQISFRTEQHAGVPVLVVETTGLPILFRPVGRTDVTRDDVVQAANLLGAARAYFDACLGQLGVARSTPQALPRSA